MNPIPLLSGRPLESFSAEEFKAYVRSMKNEPIRKTPKIRLKKQKPPFEAKLTKTGKLSLKVNRDPKWLSAEEVDSIAHYIGWTKAQTWVAVCDKKRGVKISTKEAEERISESVAAIPW